MRTGNSDVSRANVGDTGSESRTGSPLALGNPNDSRAQQVPQFRLEHGAGTTLNQALHAGQMNAELLKLGLEPTKKAYERKVAALRAAEKQSQGPNWFSKVFLGKQEKKSSLQAAATKPCVGENCKPAPKPCQGKTCRPVPPPCQKTKNCLPPPGTCLTVDGSPGAGWMPWGYIERCDDRQGACYAHLARAHTAGCDEIRRRLEQEEMRASLLLTAEQNACSSGAQTTECSSATANYQRVQLGIDQLRKQYQLCLMALNP